MREYHCPECQAVIPLEDVNVAQDIALCRKCGNVNSFCMLADISAAKTTYPTGYIPKHLTVKSEFMQGAVIKYRRISPMILFLLPFTCVWAGGSMYGIYIKPLMETGNLPELPQALFGLPFLIGSIILIASCINMLFGKTVITMQKGKGEVFIGVWPIGWRREFEYSTQSKVKIVPTSMRVNDVRQNGINITTGDKDITFGTMIDDKTKGYLAEKLKELMRSGI